MKFFLPAILAAALFYSCGSCKKTKSNTNELTYGSIDTATALLSARLNLTGDAAHQQLSAEITLSNSDVSALNIGEIVVSTDEGIRSQPIKGFAPFLLVKGKDTTLSIKFAPVNNLKLYQIAGLQGSFKPAYAISISYKTAGNDSLASITLRSQSDPNDYAAYARKYKKPITGYSFNTKTGFNEMQKKYLETLNQVKQPAFVYLTEQEVAISGLNFRLKGYYETDTLHAELFIVNHSDFAVKTYPDSLDITANDERLKPAKTITVEKISGAQQDLTILEKGDRILIHFKKHLQIKAPGKAGLVFKVNKAFMLTGKKALFCRDIELLPTQF